jgi:hypothetical protein
MSNVVPVMWVKAMDRILSTAAYLSIVGLGAYLCLDNLHDRRAGTVGICLIVFAGYFAWVDYVRERHGANLASRPPSEN